MLANDSAKIFDLMIYPPPLFRTGWDDIFFAVIGCERSEHQ